MEVAVEATPPRPAFAPLNTYNLFYNPAYNLRSMPPERKTGILHHKGSMTNREDKSQLHHAPGSKVDPDPALSQPYGQVYQITVRGQLANDWSDWFDGLNMTTSDGGDTILYGTIADQAALMGVLNKLNRLNVALLSLSQVDTQSTSNQRKVENTK